VWKNFIPALRLQRNPVKNTLCARLRCDAVQRRGRARDVEIQSTNVSIRRNSTSTAPLWFDWLVAGLVVNAGMGGANNGKEHNACQGLIAGLGLIEGPIAILVFRNRKGVFVDLEGNASLITSLPVGDYNLANEAKAYALADDIIHTAQENA
jgi:hypothetical protein